MALVHGQSFDLAVQCLYPGVIISRDGGLPSAIAETKHVLESTENISATLYQPAFQAGDLAVIVDILRRSGSAFDLIEVKASTAVKEIHIPDVAFQALVLQRAKMPVDHVLVGHVNKDFRLDRVGDYDGILIEVDVTARVKEYLPEAAERAAAFQEVMAAESMPTVYVGPHCWSPHECPFLSRCRASETDPDYPLDILPRANRVLEVLTDEGFRDLRDVPPERLTSDLHRRVYEATVSGVPFFDIAATRDLRALPSPFAYLDFETISYSVPEVIRTHPFEQVPFQWSVHVEDSPESVRHAEFLAIDEFGDLGLMARTLIDAIPSTGTVFAYNASFEKGVLDRLAYLVPKHSAELRGIAARLFDLLPVTRNAYYHRDMRGSWSIKNVMRTIDPRLGYEYLEEVQEGNGAQQAFLELRNPTITSARSLALRSALLKYCHHDTWVMVVLRRFLCGEALEIGDDRPAHSAQCGR